MLSRCFRVLLCTAIIFTVAFIFNACKKNGEEPSTIVSQNEKVPDWVLKQWDKQGRSFTQVVNRKSTAIYVNEKDEPVTFHNGLRSDRSGRTSYSALSAPCDQDDDDFLDNVFTYMYHTITYSCGQDFSLTVEYELSTAFTPSGTNPANSSQLSRGRIRFVNSSGTVIYTNNSVTPMTITLKGVDPLNANKNVYKLLYTVTNLPNSLMTSYALDQNRPIVYTDCADVITTPADWQNGLPGGATSPCSKIDNIYITPMGSNGVSFGGCDYTVGSGGSSCYSGLESARPDEHDIEWRLPGDPTYGSFPSVLSNPPALGEYDQRVAWPYLSGQGCSTMPNKWERLAWYGTRTRFFPVTGTIEIRYRNVKLNTPIDACSTNNCVGPWYTTTVTVY